MFSFLKQLWSRRVVRVPYEVPRQEDLMKEEELAEAIRQNREHVVFKAVRQVLLEEMATRYSAAIDPAQRSIRDEMLGGVDAVMAALGTIDGLAAGTAKPERKARR